MGKAFRFFIIFFALVCLLMMGLNSGWTKTPTAPVASEEAMALPLKNPRLLIEKSQRRLTLFSGNKILRVYPIGLGFAPKGTKEKQGDGKTPEGQYFIVGKNPQSRFYLSLAISYPALPDAKRGLAAKLIDQKQYQSIRQAARNKKTPPWNTPLGGEIFIHGNGSSSDWTLGCVALDNPAMKELYEALPIGTPVLIEP